MTITPFAQETALTDLPDRLVVAPAFGRVVIAAPMRFTSEGEVVRAGDVLATVHSADRAVEVSAPFDAWLLAFLVRDGERVEPGAPIVHMRKL